MIDDSDFSKIKERIHSLDRLREQIIIKSRAINRLSKKAIYTLHRNNLDEAKSLIDKARKVIKNIQGITDESPELLTVGAFGACLQEYVEAKSYYAYLTDGVMPTFEDMGVNPYHYLLGICDLTGELQRRAVHCVIQNRLEEVEKIWEVVSHIYERFLEFDLRNGELRKKSDSIKWNLKRIEEILYDLRKNEIQGSSRKD